MTDQRFPEQHPVDASGPTDPVEEGRSSFESAAEEPAPGLLREFWWFICENKAWWLVPLLLALALIGAVVWLSGTAIAPFIYPLF